MMSSPQSPAFRRVFGDNGCLLTKEILHVLEPRFNGEKFGSHPFSLDEARKLMNSGMRALFMTYILYLALIDLPVWANSYRETIASPNELAAIGADGFVLVSILAEGPNHTGTLVFRLTNMSLYPAINTYSTTVHKKRLFT